MKKLLLILLFALPLQAQDFVRRYNSTISPSGGCAKPTEWVNNSTHVFYYCDNGVWRSLPASAVSPTIGSAVTGGTAGSTLFIDGSGNLGQDNAHYFWNAANGILSIGTNAPHLTSPLGADHATNGTILTLESTSTYTGANFPTQFGAKYFVNPGSAPSYATVLQNEQDLELDGANLNGLTDGSYGSNFGAMVGKNIAATNAGLVVALTAGAVNFGSGTVGRLMAFGFPSVQNTSSGTISNAYLIDSGTMSNFGSGTINNGYAFNVNKPNNTGGGVFNQFMGYHCGLITGTATNTWCILAEGGNVEFDAFTILGSHLNQTASGKIGGTCSMSAATTCTFSLASAFTGTPICVTSSQGTAIAGSCAISGTTVTVTAASSNSQTWGAILVGNPN